MVALIGVLLAATSFNWLAVGAEVQCWAPDGKTLADNETVVPCNKLGIQQDGVYSSCCRLDGDPTKRDFCLTNGLCISTESNRSQREYCTDKTWKSPACVNICTDPNNKGSINGTADVTQCPDGTYCCGANEYSCCGTDRAITVATQASVVSSNDSNNTDNSSDAFKSATIGLAVVLGVVFIAASGIIAWLSHQNKTMKRKLSEKTEEEETHHHVPPPVVVHPYAASTTAYEPGTPAQFKDGSIPPGSPSAGSGMMVDRRHYSELDASMTRSEMGSPVQHEFQFSGEPSPRSYNSHPQTPQIGTTQ
ncbi:hypothetical protein F5Y08DRAFT_12165 [Xylaria arbuscula]|nr:hypothetical protein F5Y08DRAFT_12165 [Xylaria arbuscula]